MDEDSVVGDVVAAPVGAAVLDLLAHADGRGPELLHIGVPVFCQYMSFFATTRDMTYWWQAKIPHILAVLWGVVLCCWWSVFTAMEMMYGCFNIARPE